MESLEKGLIGRRRAVLSMHVPFDLGCLFLLSDDLAHGNSSRALARCSPQASACLYETIRLSIRNYKAGRLLTPTLAPLFPRNFGGLLRGRIDAELNN